LPNPGKSAQTKALINSRSQSPPVPIFINAIPEPPRRLEESGLRFWNEVWLLSWLNPASDIEAVALVCERMDERDQLRSYVLDNVDAWRERASLRKLEEQIEGSLKSLVVNPAERIRAGVNQAKTMSKIEEFLARKAAGK
jgi:hypothetical protein